MTTIEQRVLMQGVAAGTLIGVVFGLLIALFVATDTRSAMWLPSLFLPIALLVAWWGVLEFKAHGHRRKDG